MTEQQTPVMDAPATPATPPAPPAPPTQKSPAKKKKRKKIVKNIIITIIVLAVLAVGAFLVWKFVFAEKEEPKGEILDDTAMTGSISSMVEGSGVATAKKSATITLAAAGTVQEVFVTEGGQVTEGDPLYVITSAAAEQALQTARESLQKQQESMNELQKELSDLYESKGDLTIKTPHAGKLTDVADLRVGDQVHSGDKIAVLVDDTHLKLSLYYSYAYENEIAVGQTAQISVPATMTTYEGTVETINKVERIVTEGGKTFEVVFVIKNPGTMTAGMAASAALTASDGTEIYPYESGAFEYYRTTTISAKADGPAEQVNGLLNYANVSEGQVLVVQGTKDVDDKIATKNDSIKEQQKTLDEAVKKVEDEQKALDDFSATSPMSGTVISCTLVQGEEVESGRVAVTIADTTTMTVTLTVDERNVTYIQPGMPIDLNDWDGNYFMGNVESVALEGKNENGVTTYPVVVKVDNPDGALRNQMNLNYSFAAAQSDGCVVVPIQDVRYISLGGTEPTSVVYLKADTRPEQAVADEDLPQEVLSELPEGYYVVPVVTGLSDQTNVEIKEGLQDGDTVFNNYIKDQASSWG